MKRILIILGLLACFALPAQIASAYSYNSSLSFADNINGLAQEAGGRVQQLPPALGTYDLLQLYGNVPGVNILGSDLVAQGFSIVQDVDTGAFKLVDPYTGAVALQAAITETYMVKKTTNAVYEYNGNTIAIQNGSIFMSISTAAGSFVLLAVPTGVYPASPVPVPAAVWLTGTGLAGLMAMRRRNR